MSASDEWWVWHLTLRGWVKGSEKLDFHPTVGVRPPLDRVMSVTVYDYWPDVQQRQHWEEIDYRHENQAVVDALLAQYGGLSKAGFPEKHDAAAVR